MADDSTVVKDKDQDVTLPGADASAKKPDGQGEVDADKKAQEEAVAEAAKVREQAENLAKEHANLQELYGRQSNELGELRSQTQEMVAQMAAIQDQLKASATAATTGQEARINEIYEAIDASEMTLGEGLRELQQFQNVQLEAVREQATKDAIARVTDEFGKELKSRDAKATQGQWLKDNPDFLELQKSGALEGIKQKNAMHDDFSAYYELKAMQGFDKGKEEQAKIEKGVGAASKVLTKPGGSVRQLDKPTKPLTDSDMKARGMDVLDSLEQEAMG